MTCHWPDGKTRCSWANPNNPAYLAYHDNEWGVPVFDDQKLFEMLILECFQAGLSWECVLNRREAFREAFCNFDIDAVCAFDQRKIEELLQDTRLIRNRLKMQAAVNNARIFKLIQEEFGSFSAYLWNWTSEKTIQETGLSSSPLSDALSKDLKKRGMKFTGTTIVYSYLQAVGIIDSHEEGCYLCHAEKSQRQ